MSVSVCLQELPGYGQSFGVSSPLLVRPVGGLHHWRHEDLCVWIGLPARLLLFSAVWDPAFGEIIQNPPRLVGLSDHVQRGSHCI